MRKPSIHQVSIVEVLVATIAVLAVMAALAGLFLPGGDGPFTITTYRGQEEEIFGRGLYRDSSVFHGAGARGTDAVTLLVGVPLLLAGLVMHRRGSIRGTLLVAGGLAWTLYVYASTSLGTVAYHDLFLLHVALFGASLWAFGLLLASVTRDEPGMRVERGVPRRGLAIFLFASGLVTAGIWLIEPVVALVSGELPESLGVSTTLVTYALDLAIIAPATILTGMLVLRGRAAGYLYAVPILILEAMLAPMMIAQTIFQIEAGVDFTAAQVAIFIGGFMALALVAMWMLRGIFRHIDDPVVWRPFEHGYRGILAQ